MQKVLLNGTWEFQKAGDKKKYTVKIPGSVLSGCLEHELIPDPFDRTNEYDTREMFWDDYVFEREFEVSANLLEEDHLELVCEGLDTLTEIRINGTLVAKTENMHCTYRIPVKEYLHIGENHIQILFTSVLKYIKNYPYEQGKEIQYVACGAMKGNELIRKAHSMFGWDWGPQLIDAGIFRDIYLEAYTEGKITDVAFHQIHEEDIVHEKKALLQTKVSFASTKGEELTLKATLFGPNGEELQVHKESVAQGTESTEFTFEITDPKLWWPNDYGDAALYTVSIVLKDGETELSSDTKRIGLRTLTVSRDKDEWGSEFAFKINGIKIFARGGNYIPEDCLYSRITKDIQEDLLESCRRAHFNCVRVWGGGYYPSDTFYDLCDEKGLIVWQDLMYACNVYDVNDRFADSCRQEAIENVSRLRHHACLGLWCGNNEIESAWHHWPAFQKETAYLRADYIKLFEDVLPKAVKTTDPDTFYWPSSPSSGGCFDFPDDDTRGDNHYWDVWHGQKPFTDYHKYFFRFCSEFGFQSFPCYKTVETFARKEDQNIFSRVMESHQKNDSANGKMLYYLSENLRYPKDFKHLLYASQILQGMAIKYGVDHWRRHRGRCMGTLYWQINDDWPAPSWASIDYFGRWKALHYMAAKFYAPLALSSYINSERTLEVCMANESLQARDFHAEVSVKNMQLEVLEKKEADGHVEPQSVSQILTWDLEAYEDVADEVFVESVVTFEDGTVQKDVEILSPYKYLELQKPKIHVDAEETPDAFIITLSADCFAPFVYLDFVDADVIFEDNFFHVTETEPVKIRLEKTDIRRGSFTDADDLVKRLEITTLADSYE